MDIRTKTNVKILEQQQKESAEEIDTDDQVGENNRGGNTEETNEGFYEESTVSHDVDSNEYGETMEYGQTSDTGLEIPSDTIQQQQHKQVHQQKRKAEEVMKRVEFKQICRDQSKGRKDREKLIEAIQEGRKERMDLLREISHNQSRPAPEMTENQVDLFFKTMCATVKSFPPHLIFEAKRKVFNVISDLECRAAYERETTMHTLQQRPSYSGEMHYSSPLTTASEYTEVSPPTSYLTRNTPSTTLSPPTVHIEERVPLTNVIMQPGQFDSILNV